MQDLTSPFWIKLKGLLFLLLGTVAAALLLLDSLTLKTAGLLAVAIGAFAGFTISPSM